MSSEELTCRMSLSNYFRGVRVQFTTVSMMSRLYTLTPTRVKDVIFLTRRTSTTRRRTTAGVNIAHKVLGTRELIHNEWFKPMIVESIAGHGKDAIAEEVCRSSYVDKWRRNETSAWIPSWIDKRFVVRARGDQAEVQCCLIGIGRI